jgi:receptor protein-tyrosine kinase
MFRRKRAHLVERAVEHLAQSGALDESAAQLLEPDHSGGLGAAPLPSATIEIPTRDIPTTHSPAAVTPIAQPGGFAGRVAARSGPAVGQKAGPDTDAYPDSAYPLTAHDEAVHHADASFPDTSFPDPLYPGAVAVAAWDVGDAPEAPSSEIGASDVRAEHGFSADPTIPDAYPAATDLATATDPPAGQPAVTNRGLPAEGPGPHTLIPPEEGAGQPFVDMTSLFRAGMIDWNRVRSRVSEEFRLVQRQIVRTAFTAAGAEPGFSNLLMITSSIPGEGKSFTSLNLAACIARQRDHHVLLIDIDSKRDSFCMALGLGDAPGLLDLAANPDLDAAQVMAKTAIENLTVLPIGIERDLGPELFASKQMTKLIQAIGRRYADRLIVLDAPPTLSTSDPAALAPIVGQVLFVVEAERTQREEVESSLDLLQACPTITLLLNKVQVQTRYTFGAYSTYYTS